MSYDWDGNYRPIEKKGIWDRIAAKYWGFVIWAALDAKSERINRWGLNRLTKKEDK